MEEHLKILNPLKWMCGTAGVIGLGIFILSLFASEYNKDYLFSIIGLMLLITSLAIFLVGMFFIVMEEMVMNTEKGERVIPTGSNVIAFKRKRRTLH
ncbi:hypothetical protein [Peribacillus asahii]|uniref:hypothetical protein n=1 Tax=Peribacillus asahii TaxID=228899 RepID=UPI00382CBFA7